LVRRPRFATPGCGCFLHVAFFYCIICALLFSFSELHSNDDRAPDPESPIPLTAYAGVPRWVPPLPGGPLRQWSPKVYSTPQGSVASLLATGPIPRHPPSGVVCGRIQDPGGVPRPTMLMVQQLQQAAGQTGSPGFACPVNNAGSQPPGLKSPTGSRGPMKVQMGNKSLGKGGECLVCGFMVWCVEPFQIQPALLSRHPGHSFVTAIRDGHS